MFKYKKTGIGVINGNWVVFFLDAYGEDVNMSFHDKEWQAADKVKYLNDILANFICIIKK